MIHPGRKKGLGKEYRGIATLKSDGGPGGCGEGWHCRCCNPYQVKTNKMKSLAHRLVRRKIKQILSPD